MMIKISNILLFVCLSCSAAFSQDDLKYVREGNKQYEEGEYEKAGESYQKALSENSNSSQGTFNLGDAAYKQEKYEEAAAQFETFALRDDNKENVAKSYHNLGNSLMMSKEYAKSVEAYKNALRNNPSDAGTKYNLAYAQQKLAEQQKQKNEEKEEKDDKENKEKDEPQSEDDQKKEKEDQDQKDKKEDDKKSESEQNQNEKTKEEEQQEQEKQPQPNQISQEDAKKLLDALKNEEQNVQNKLTKNKMKATRINIEKDW
ncbi:MAG TPA: tetratricopeptide repeat protein [Flavobacteriales bacterium]|nr:tetratricopeptide repeat protein [Flavobacteriales bacterium]